MVRRKSGSRTTKSESSASRNASVAVKKPGEPSLAAFDLFLDRGLHRLFDAVKDEPIPDELLRIIEEDRQK